MLGLLYDIHGNLPALEEVLSEADAAGVDRWLLGGDYGTPSPWPLETLERLRQLENATWIRGNGERWLREPPEDRPEVMKVYEHFTGGLPEEEIDVLYRLPPRAELDGVLYVHGSPLSDVESFAPEPQADEARMLGGEHDRAIVFGHSHQQFAPMTASSRSGVPSTTSSARLPPTGRWATTSASSPRGGSSAAPTRRGRRRA